MDYLIHLSIFFSIYAILALSLNLVVGYTGLLSVAHAAFYGIGAYVTAILTTQYGMNFFPSVVIGMALATFAAFFIGFFLSSFKGDYYAIGSLSFNVIILACMFNLQEITRGPFGISGIPRPILLNYTFNSNLSFLALAFAFFLSVLALVIFISRSSFCRVLKAIREDEKVLSVFGYKTPSYKLVIFILSAALSAIGGSLYAGYVSYVDPTSFDPNESIFLLTIIILGGLGTVTGSLLGTLVMILFPELLRFIGFPDDVAAQMRQLFYGIILVLLMFYRPQGLVGEYKI